MPLSGCLCVQNRRGSNTAQRITWLQVRPQQRLLKLPLPGATSTVWIGAARHCLNRRRLESNWSHVRNKEVPLSGCLCVQNCFNAILLRESPDCKRDHSKDCWSYHFPPETNFTTSSMTWVGNRRRGSNTAQRITWLQARPQQRLLKLPLPAATSTVWIGAARHCLNRRRLESNWSHARNKEVPWAKMATVRIIIYWKSLHYYFWVCDIRYRYRNMI